MEELTTISAQVSEDLAIRARVEASKLNISRSEYIRRAITAYLLELQDTQAALDAVAARKQQIGDYEDD